MGSLFARVATRSDTDKELLPMRRLSSTSLMQKLLIIAAIPLVAVIYFVHSDIDRQLTVLNDADSTKALPSHLDSLSRVIHEMQKERGNSAGYLSSKGKNFKTQLAKQRGLMDQAILGLNSKSANLSDLSLPGFQAGVARVKAMLGEIADTRRKVDALQLTVLFAAGRPGAPVIGHRQGRGPAARRWR